MNSVEVNSDSVMKMFSELDQRHRKQVFRSAMNKASAILVNEAKSQLRQTVSRTKTKRWKGRSLEQGIRKRISKDAKEAKVHLMGDFRLKFFELGTKGRKTKRHSKAKGGQGGYRGKVRSAYFFRTSKQLKEKELFDSLDKIISGQVEKVNQKYLNR